MSHLSFMFIDRPLEAPQIHVAALSSDSVEVTLSRSNESDNNKDIITRYEGMLDGFLEIAFKFRF